MPKRHYILPTAAFLTILIGLGVLDAMLTVEQHPWQAQQASTVDPSSPSTPTPTPPSPNTPNPNPNPNPNPGVIKKRSPKVREIATVRGFVLQDTRDALFLPQVVPQDKATIETAVLLKDGDRAGVIAWTEGSDVKLYFRALKEALHSFFTPAITDLVDEMQRQDGRPPRNFLTFLDAGISEERIVFVRVRDRLYEVHIAGGKEEEMFGLLDALSSN